MKKTVPAGSFLVHELTRRGLDVARLGFTLRTAAAVCCAIGLAWLLGLEHPQWSGMTVWAASQPVRGHLLEKSLFRVFGTVLGVLFGMGLLLASGGGPWLIVVGLSLWIGLCAGAGNVVRGFAAYGTMLAGYSAAMVTLLHSLQSDSEFAIGIDRMLTVLLGILVALVAGWFFAAPARRDDAVQQARQLAAQLLENLAGQGGDAGRLRLLSAMALFEDELDHHAAGSLRLRKTVQAARRLLSAQVAVILRARQAACDQADTALAVALREAAAALRRADGLERAGAALRQASALARASQSGAADALDELAAALSATNARAAFALHRDWTGARQALLRAAAANMAVGAVWLVTGWEAGAFMLLGTAIMTTIFSSADNPVHTLRYVFVGQALGVAAALACRWLVWPLAGSEAGLLAMLPPFIFLGALLLAHRRLPLPVGFDYSMVLLLLLQPQWPLAGTLAHSLSMALAVMLAPVIGLLAYRFIFPTSGRKRLQMLAAMMVHDIEAMAGHHGIAAGNDAAAGRARLHHRVLRLARWADKTGNSPELAFQGGFAMLLLGEALGRIEVLGRARAQPPAAIRRLHAAKMRLRAVGEEPLRAARALERLAGYCAEHAPADADVLRQAAAALRDAVAFVQLAKQRGD